MRPFFSFLLSVTLFSLVRANFGGYWYENIEHNGISPFIPNGENWKVFRNVKDYGAKGDGLHDDTAAIQAAINDQDRGPDGNGKGTTGAPASVYFPEGNYLVQESIQLYVDTVLIGNPQARPVIRAASGFKNKTLIVGQDPSLDSTINFYIAVKNLVLDSTFVNRNTDFLLLDWSVSQATQLTNVLFNMPLGSQHTGVATPGGGSGTYMGNLDFVGGATGINMNNQQYSIKDTTFTGCSTGIVLSHGFDMVFQGLKFTNCEIGINSTVGSFGNVGSFALVDSVATSVPKVIVTKSQKSGNTTTADDSIIIDNLETIGCQSTVIAGESVILTGSVPRTWVYGDAFLPGVSSMAGAHDFGTTYPTNRPAALVSNGKYFTMAPPTYQQYSLQNVINVKTVEGLPVHGDGTTDDTANINSILEKYANSNAVLFFPAGTYIVTDTIFIPKGTQIVGEVWSAISASGDKFSNAESPLAMVKVGNPGDVGVAQISDMLLTVADILPGCILLEVNMAGAQPGDVATWNTHFRVGGASGSKVQTGCSNDDAPCKAAFLLLHLTPSASIYIEDMWGWTADHDLDANNNEVISTGRGALVEATRGTWLVGTAFEHNTLYQYNLAAAENVYVGMQQSETPYWQGTGTPAQAPAPWTSDSSFSDPTFDNCGENDPNCRMAWYEIVSGGSNLNIYGSGFWTFFNHLGSCEGQNGTCQNNAVDIVGNPSQLFWWNLNTRGCLNLVVDDGKVLTTQNNNLGSWGAVVAAVLTHSGLPSMARRFLRTM
jgi:glucan 1,3-beta-glucosidase